MREEVACLIHEHAPESARILIDDIGHDLFGDDGWHAVEFSCEADYLATMPKVQFALGELSVDPEHDGQPRELMLELSKLTFVNINEKVVLS